MSAAEAAEVPGSGGVAHRTPVDSARGGELRSRAALALLAGALALLWALAGPRTPDLAAATYRVNLFGHLGFLVLDTRWYAGHDLPGYSLLFPALGALLGLRTVGALAVLCSSLLFERLTRPLYGWAAVWGSAVFALAAVGDVWSGRVSFALGVPFGLGALLALRACRATGAWRRRGAMALTVLLAASCAAASPVAGALLGLAALTLSVWQRSPRALLTLALPAGLLVLALVLLFPEGGYEPFPLLSFLAGFGAGLLFLLALPRVPGTRPLRIGGVLYLLACLACLLVRTPMGSNVERYGVLLAAPLLLCATLSSPQALRRPALAGPALALIAVWVLWGPFRESAAVAGSRATSAAYYQPLERYLARLGPVRVEVPLTRSHWEAALLAPVVSLARGWEKQLEERYDHVLLSSSLTPSAYRGWLREEAVSYVALPDARLDGSSAAEGRLIRRGLPFLHEVFAGGHWRVYRVLEATPIASGPGRLLWLGHDALALRAARPGTFLVRVHYSRYWAFARGAGCVTPAPGGWMRVRVDFAGTSLLRAGFTLSRALGLAGACSRGVPVPAGSARA